MPGLILAAPSSGAGKTTVTLGLLRALRDAGVAARGAKSGPDYIDPRFHEAASGAPCPNLDAWAMGPDMLRGLAAGPGLLLIEGAMGLFDAARMAQSVAPLVAGFAAHDPAVRVAGVILNRIGSPRHEAMLRAACPLPVLGALPRDGGLATPSRHLGLVQAAERPDLDAFLERAAAAVREGCDLDGLAALARPLAEADPPRFDPPAQSVAVARDEAFAFAYPHLLDGWRRAGAEIRLFSPLADEPAPPADLVLLPGGYPELHAGRLAANARFLRSLRDRAVHGECGGYMVMGDALTDAEGATHRMAGLLRLETSFAERRLHLGYRGLRAVEGPFAGAWAGHEFHYATTLRAEGAPLFEATDAEGTPLPPMGLRDGAASGSFAHLIAPARAYPHNPTLDARDACA